MPADAAHSDGGQRQATGIGWTLPLIVAGGVLLVAAKLAAGPLVLPMFSMMLLGAGFTVASVLYGTGSRIGHGRDGAWLAAAALVFLGFAAALLSDGPDALAQFDRMLTAAAVGS